MRADVRTYVVNCTHHICQIKLALEQISENRGENPSSATYLHDARADLFVDVGVCATAFHEGCPQTSCSKNYGALVRKIKNSLPELS